MFRQTIALIALASPLIALAGQTPQPGRHDPRIRFVNYSPDNVILITVQRGTATRIVLGEGEKIQRDGSATGFSSDCAKAEAEWCIHAETGTNQILVKPKDGATHNNLELRTDRRDYSFAFAVLPDASKRGASLNSKSGPMFRVVFRYPTDLLLPSQGNRHLTSSDPYQGQSNDPVSDRTVPAPRNWRYSMQARKGAEDITPSLVFDDGRFTYFQFPANREIPAVFYISPAGEEARVNFHMHETDDALLVVERTARRFVLRLGAAAVGVWNDAYDSTGVPARDGTTVKGLARELRQGETHER
jgi:type IV secretion system protein VirB9